MSPFPFSARNRLVETDKLPSPPSTAESMNRAGLTLVKLADRQLDLNRLVETILAATQATGVAIAMQGSSGICCCAASGITAPPVGTQLSSAGGLTNLCLTTGEIQLCNDVEQDSRADAAACTELGIRSVLVFPLKLEGRTFGVLDILSAHENAFDHECVAAAATFAEQVRRLAAGMLHGEEIRDVGIT
jgi:GAF domain-containing protein